MSDGGIVVEELECGINTSRARVAATDPHVVYGLPDSGRLVRWSGAGGVACTRLSLLQFVDGVPRQAAPRKERNGHDGDGDRLGHCERAIKANQRSESVDDCVQDASRSKMSRGGVMMVVDSPVGLTGGK